MPPGLEVKRRLEILLDKFESPLEDPYQLRLSRCLTLLERIDSPESRQFLEELSQGAPGAWLTVEARHSLQRSRIPSGGSGIGRPRAKPRQVIR
jgi:hypothetical protein